MLELERLEQQRKELKHKIDRLDAKQLCIKVLINSIYGYFGNKHAPFGDDDIASSITLTGQSVIKTSNELLKKYIKQQTGIDDERTLNDCIIYNDTDSYTGDTQVVTDKGIYDAISLWKEYDNSEYKVSSFGHEIIPVVNLKVWSYDDKTKTNKFRKIKNLIRHKVSKEKYKIKVGNREIIMTGDHGCLVKRGDKLVRVSARDVKTGDKMLVIHMKEIEVTSIERLDDFDDEYVYDLEMYDQEQPWFYANDILIHNSSYISVKPLIDKGLTFTDDNGKITEEFYNEVKKIEDFLNKEIIVWGNKALNSKDCRFVFKREMISDVGIFLQKKRYVMHVLDDEGIAMDKYKYTGVEVVRSTMPDAIKPHVKQIIETMLSTQSLAKTNEILNKTYKIFKNLPVEDITFVSGIKGYEKYASQCDEWKTAKGMPIHVKAAYYHNMLLKKFNIEKDYETISSGDKIRYFYLQQPNPYNLNCIGYKYYFPEEFKKILHVDYDKMFEKILYAVIERFYDNVKWSISKPGNAVVTNLFDLLS